MHTNSLDAWKDLDTTKRRHAIIAQYDRPLTDRQVAERLGFSDMNRVRPRITELIADRVLIEVGSVKDHSTGRTVRLVARYEPWMCIKCGQPHGLTTGDVTLRGVAGYCETCWDGLISDFRYSSDTK